MQGLEKQSGTWKWGILCLLFLAPFFFLTYGFANQHAARLSHVTSMVFNWETLIPLWPWTIVPYWSIDLFYGLSLLLCWNKFELKQHALRLFSAQIISISCFLIYPLRFTFERPELSGFFGLWFDVLMGFDKPFNQAPSLHIVLLVILWDFFRRHTSGQWKYIVDFWSFLIGLSVLTTWQHHFIDIPTGLLVGAFCLWLVPIDTKSPFQKDTLQVLTPKHLKLGSFYLGACLILTVTAFLFKSWALWLLYPAFSLLLVSFTYFFVRPHFFQKNRIGKIPAGAWILFSPYFVFAWINSRVWTRAHPEDSLVIELPTTQIYLGRIPHSRNQKNYDALFDCCAELEISKNTLKKNQHINNAYQFYFSLDLIPLQANQLEKAVENFDRLFENVSKIESKNNAILVFCALGYSRSSAILCAWLVKNQHVNSVNEAIHLIQKARPWIVLNEQQVRQINIFHLKLKGLAP